MKNMWHSMYRVNIMLNKIKKTKMSLFIFKINNVNFGTSRQRLTFDTEYTKISRYIRINGELWVRPLPGSGTQ